jgi:hypothetical protein
MFAQLAVFERMRAPARSARDDRHALHGPAGRMRRLRPPKRFWREISTYTGLAGTEPPSGHPGGRSKRASGCRSGGS